MPTAIASENSSASSSGRAERTLITKIETVSDAGDPHEQPENSRRPDLEAGLRARRSDRPAAICPNSRAPAGRHHHAAAGARVHDRAHERARREVGQRGAWPARGAATSRPAATRR